jgi:VIT1/CCC1 family predicted Fe2+/Mn2+ transporter
MDEKYRKYEKTLKRKISFGWIPKHTEDTSTNLTPPVFMRIAEETFKALGWIVVSQEKDSISAWRNSPFDKVTHTVTVKVNQFGRVDVTSQSQASLLFDFGKNYKLANLFIHAFNETLKEFDDERLLELEKEVEAKHNWTDYEIPDSLPQPKDYKNPSGIFPFAGALVVSVTLAFIIALLSAEGIYIIFLFEIIAGFALGFSIAYLMKVGNFTNLKTAKFITIGAVVLIFILNQVFQYLLIMSAYFPYPIGFFNFIKLRLEHGLYIDNLNLGTIGLLASWALQLGLTYFVAFEKISNSILFFVMKRVPKEVIEFAAYHFAKGKTKYAVKQELTQMGWKSDLEHQMVMEVFGKSEEG